MNTESANPVHAACRLPYEECLKSRRAADCVLRQDLDGSLVEAADHIERRQQIVSPGHSKSSRGFHTRTRARVRHAKLPTFLAGIGASHQTGWTGVVARLIELFGRLDGDSLLAGGKAEAFSQTQT